MSEEHDYCGRIGTGFPSPGDERRTLNFYRALHATERSEITECKSVLALLRAHRLNPDTWDQPIPSDLLSRENAILGYLKPEEENDG
jgi:hypothetical protein